MGLFPQSAMNADGYVLPSTSRLQCIGVTEIVLGALAVIGSIYDLINRHSYYGFYVSCAVLLLGTGIHGVRAIRRYRMRILDGRSFRILGACNAMLFIFYSVCLLILILFVITRMKMPSTAHGNVEDYNDRETVQEMRRKYDELTWRNNMFLVGLVVAAVLATLLIGITATAATISFRLAASISAASRHPVMVPPAGVPVMARPGYGTYPMAYMEPPPTYTPYAPVKQNLE